MANSNCSPSRGTFTRPAKNGGSSRASWRLHHHEGRVANPAISPSGSWRSAGPTNRGTNSNSSRGGCRASSAMCCRTCSGALASRSRSPSARPRSSSGGPCGRPFSAAFSTGRLGPLAKISPRRWTSRRRRTTNTAGRPSGRSSRCCSRTDSPAEVRSRDLVEREHRAAVLVGEGGRVVRRGEGDEFRAH
jgi:hypothetical protein